MCEADTWVPQRQEGSMKDPLDVNRICLLKSTFAALRALWSHSEDALRLLEAL